ncbi:MAG: extracellular solute-binding protein [Hyphomicrobiaceae bacterium]|nr:extracellular solute-binding protein [Hyphomicrobiaceae bacterium]
MTKVTRRRFIATTAGGAAAAATGGIAGILATGRFPAIAQTTTVHWLRWNDFVPTCDKLIREKLAPEAEKALGIKINFETVNGNDLQPRITSGIQSGAGPDLIMLFNNHPHLYAASLADLSDVAEEVGKEQGGYYGISEGNCKAGGKWVAMPMCIIGALNAYRKSWFAEAGANKFPETWDEYRAVGKKLKAKGTPIGQALGQSFGDPPTFAYPFMWSFGGMEVDDKGAVVINSKETVEAVKYMTAFWKDSCDEGGLAWDDASNNRAFLAGEVSSTLNGASIYLLAAREKGKYLTDDKKELSSDILHGELPAGPKGKFAFHTFQSHVLPSYSKNQKAAKDLLRFIHKKENYEQWFTTGLGFDTPGTKSWETHPMWEKDPVMKPYAVAGKLGATPGRAGPPNAKAAEVLSKYLIVNMFASAIKGQAAEDAVKAAEAELKKIYT